MAGAIWPPAGPMLSFNSGSRPSFRDGISGVLKMDIFANVLLGFQVALQPINLFFCFIGVLIGTLVGVLPGLGPVAAMSLLLPSTFHVSPVSAIIMLAGIYYGAMYGGSTTSILVNIPGEAASVVTCLDGYQMARKGRAGPALGIAAFGSFIAGTLSIIGLMFLAPPLAEMALQFGPPEYFCLMLLGLIILTFLAGGSMPKALIMAAFGLFLGLIGMDIMTATPRFTFGLYFLSDGVGLVPVVMGLFGISEVLLNVEAGIKRDVFKTKIKGLLPNLKDWKDSAWPIVRGSVIGLFPRHPSRRRGGDLFFCLLCRGEKESPVIRKNSGPGLSKEWPARNRPTMPPPEGPSSPCSPWAFPSNAVMAMLLGALIIYGMQPGPMLIKQHPDLFWGVVTSMYIGNVMLLVLNLPLIGLWVKILKIPYPVLFPLILLFCLIGVYSLNNNTGGDRVDAVLRGRGLSDEEV